MITFSNLEIVAAQLQLSTLASHSWLALRIMQDQRSTHLWEYGG